MKITFTKHAEIELIRRKIEKKLALNTIKNPQQKSRFEDLHIYQSKYFDKNIGKQMLLRVFSKEGLKGLEVITVYKTSKIKKYWKV